MCLLGVLVACAVVNGGHPGITRIAGTWTLTGVDIETLRFGVDGSFYANYAINSGGAKELRQFKGARFDQSGSYSLDAAATSLHLRISRPRFFSGSRLEQVQELKYDEIDPIILVGARLKIYRATDGSGVKTWRVFTRIKKGRKA